MNIKETLTKENFWNKAHEMYPKACGLFCEWVDRYKKDVDWSVVFNSGNPLGEGQCQAPKYHDLPYAMQQGIWIEFAQEALHKYYKEPEYVYLGDLEGDIHSVFSQLESIL